MKNLLIAVVLTTVLFSSCSSTREYLVAIELPQEGDHKEIIELGVYEYTPGLKIKTIDPLLLDLGVENCKVIFTPIRRSKKIIMYFDREDYPVE